MLEHIYLSIDQYLSVITFRRDLLQVGYSPLSLYYILLTSIKPRFSFWNNCYRFAPNSKFQSAREDRETHERVELLRKK